MHWYIKLQKKFGCFRFWKFLIPSIIGLFCFLAPIVDGQSISIPIAILSKIILSFFNGYLGLCVVAILSLCFGFSALGCWFKPRFIVNHAWLSTLFCTSTIHVLLRGVGFLIALAVFTGVGPDFIRAENTGSLVLNQLLPPILINVFLAGVLLPLLLNFGLLEFVGALMTKIMRPLFRLPGRSAIDCLTSWVGDCSVGLLLTVKQYEAGYYSQKEAAIIGTTFSAASITFCFLVISQVQLEHMFGFFYLTTLLASFVAAIIVPRLPPLCWKKDIYVNGSRKPIHVESQQAGVSVFEQGLTLAMQRADAQPAFTSILKQGVQNAISMLVHVVPVVMVVGVCGLVIAEYTPILHLLGKPFVPVLESLGVPYAQQASSTILVGFADMFIPSTLAATIPSEMTRFVIAVLSVSQLVFLSEIGAILLGSQLPVYFWDLLLIFLLRTLITLPIIVGCAHLIFS